MKKVIIVAFAVILFIGVAAIWFKMKEQKQAPVAETSDVVFSASALEEAQDLQSNPEAHGEIFSHTDMTAAVDMRTGAEESGQWIFPELK